MRHSANAPLREIIREEWRYDGGRKNMMLEFGLVALLVGVFAAFGVRPIWLVAGGLLFLGLALSVLSTYVVRVFLVRRDGYDAQSYNALYGRMRSVVVWSLASYGVGWFLDCPPWLNLFIAFGVGVLDVILDAASFIEKQLPIPSETSESTEAS